MGLSVELQPRDGGWVKLGTQTGGGAGVRPGSIEFSADLAEYGPLEATFRLKLNPRWPRDIIEHFTPVVISDGADHRFSGRIIAAPTTFAEDAEVVVQCQGWGQHTKDDCTAREWVTNDISRFAPLDGFSTSQIVTEFNSACVPEVGGTGSVILRIPQGAAATQNRGNGVIIDFGPDPAAWPIYFAASYRLKQAVGTASFLVCAISSDTPMNIYTGTGNTFEKFGGSNAANPGVGPNTIGGSVSTARRYVNFYWIYTGATTTFGADHSIYLDSFIAATDATDVSSLSSALKASTGIGETLDACCPLISSDHSQIATTTTSIPNFPGSPGYRYANELIDQFNSIHGYAAKCSPDPVPVFSFQPLPTDYSFAVGAGEYTLLEPAAQDGRTVYNRVISEYEDAAGVRAESSVTNPVIPHTAQPLNPSFTTDTGFGSPANWSNFGSSVFARDTAIYDTTPSSARLEASGVGSRCGMTSDKASLGGIDLNLTADYRYIARIRIRRAQTVQNAWITTDQTSTTVVARNAFTDAFNALPTGSFSTLDIPFYAISGQPTHTDDITIAFNASAAGVVAYIDDIQILRTDTTVLDRRGLRRTALKPINQASNATIAAAIAQLKLDNSQYPPFKGTIAVHGSVRTKGGGSMRASGLPACVGDALLIENLTDPNTGALGRQGIIRTAKYNEAMDVTELTIDDPTGFLDILVTRLANASRR